MSSLGVVRIRRGDLRVFRALSDERPQRLKEGLLKMPVEEERRVVQHEDVRVVDEGAREVQQRPVRPRPLLLL